MIDYQQILDQYYKEDNELRHILLVHSQSVAHKALQIVSLHPELNLDARFVEEAAMLHDIGVRWCNAPGIQCFGTSASVIPVPVFHGKRLSVSNFLCPIATSCPKRWRSRSSAMPTSSSRKPVWTARRPLNRRSTAWPSSARKASSVSAAGQKCSNELTIGRMSCLLPSSPVSFVIVSVLVF